MKQPARNVFNGALNDAIKQLNQTGKLFPPQCQRAGLTGRKDVQKEEETISIV